MSEYEDYCSQCLHYLRDCDLPREEPVGCPWCHCGLLMVIGMAERNRRINATRTAWDAAIADGLIQCPAP